MKKKEVIVFSGGLGNQLFQYAFLLAKQKQGSRVSYNTYSIRREGVNNGFELPRLFAIPDREERSYRLRARLARKLLIFQSRKGFGLLCDFLRRCIRLTGLRIVQEPDYSTYHAKYLVPAGRQTLYFGFWQTARYFESFESELRNIYSFDSLPVLPQTQVLLSRLPNEESVAIHIRRGDFYISGNQELYGGIASDSYYREAIQLITKKVNRPFFLIFSDNPEWAKAHLSLPSAVYVDWNRGEDSWQDMLLMSRCRHNIIANSTFSWWGAWLNAHPNKLVIAPKRFLNKQATPDVYPPTWITIE